MLDTKLRPLINPALEKVVDILVRTGVSANQITVLGFAFGLLACAALYWNVLWVAFLFFLVNRFMDGIDGILARRKQASDFGGFLDIVLDFIIYSAIPFTFALKNPEDAIMAAFLIFSFVGTGTTFLAFAIFAVKIEMQKNIPHARKSFLYLGGLMEGTETFIALGALFLFPEHFFWIALVTGVLCWLTTAQRMYYAYRVYG